MPAEYSARMKQTSCRVQYQINKNITLMVIHISLLLRRLHLDRGP